MVLLETKHIKRHFEERQTAILMASSVLVTMGIVALLLGGISFLSEVEVPFIRGIILTVTGVGLIASGIWGISFSRKRNLELAKYTLVVYESSLGLLCGWICYICSIVASVAIFAAVFDDSMNMFALSFVCLLCAFAAVFCFYVYRNRRIMVFGAQIFGVTAFGREYRFFRDDIYEIKHSLYNGGFKILDDQGRKLIGFENNMVNAEKLFNELKGACDCKCEWYDTTAGRYKNVTEVQWDPSKETWQHRQIKKIKVGYYLLCAANVVVLILILVVFPKADMGQRYHVLIIGLQPLTYCVFIWVFADVVDWLAISNIKQSKEWKEKHLSMVLVYIYGIFVLLCIAALEKFANFIQGERMVCLAGVLFALLLWGITVLRIRKRPHKKAVYVFAAFVMAVVSWGVTLSTVVAIVKPTAHYPATILETSESTGGRRHPDHYYATIMLPDGSTKKIDISHSDYEDIQNGEEKVVCEREHPIGIRIIYLHDKGNE